MFDFLDSIIFSRQYIPYGHCYLWQSGLLWLHLLSDALIALAYYSIALTLIYFIRQRDNAPFKGMFVLFSLFIFSCGTNHIMSIWTLWHPDYWLSGLIKVITAIISVFTAVKMIPTLPKALALSSPVELETANQALELEITNRQQAEITLQQLNLELKSRVEQRTREFQKSEQRFRSLFEAVPDFIYLLNLQGQIEQVNPAVIQKSGYEESELINQPLVNFLSSSSQQLSHQEFSDFLQEGEKRQEVEFVCQNNQVLTMDCAWTVVGDTQKNDAYIIVWQRDISEQQAALRKSQRIEEKLRKTNQQLLRSNEELEQFAYLASHDLREPLRMVTSFTQLLAQRYSGKLDADADQIIGFAVDGSIRMEELIHDLLEYSRVGKQDKSFAIVDCESVLDLCAHNLQLLIQETNTTITRMALPTVIGKQGQLIQLFQNLIENAIVYRSQKSPKIEIAVKALAEQWLFSVKDNGIGIAPQYQERIFQIFQRLHTRQEYPGTGIGLAICHKIIERHGGKIWVESAAGEGATFYFTLPKETERTKVKEKDI